MFTGKSKFCEKFHVPENLKNKKSNDKIHTFKSLDKSVRKDLFEEKWEVIESKLLKFTSGLFGQYVEKLYDFISSNILDDLNDEDSPKLIPTAIIALNSKHTQKRIANEIDELFNRKMSQIKTIHLDSFQTTNLTNLFQVIFSCLLNLDDSDLTFADLKFQSFDEVLQRWMDNYCEVRPSLTIFFHDFENINKEVLSHLVSILKGYTNEISIVLVFMIYNQVNSTLQYILPSNVTDCLIIQDMPPFYEPKLLPHLFKEFIVDSSILFKIHPLLINEIYSLFSNYEFAFSHFIHFIKSIVLNHFFTNPLSTIYSLKALKQSRDNKLEETFRNCLNITFDDSENYLDQLHSAYRTLIQKHSQFTQDIEILSAFREYCLHEKTKEFTYLYSKILTGQFDLRDYLVPLFKVKDSTFISAIRRVSSEFEDANNPLMKCIVDFKHDLENLLAKESEENRKQVDFAKKFNLDYDGNVQIAKTKLRGLHARIELRKSLMASIQNSQKLSPLEKLKGEFVHSILDMFDNHVLMDQKELIDALFYHNANFIRTYHIVSIRERLDSSLFLKYSSASASDNIVSYRLYKEAGKNINLFKLFNDFCDERQLNKKKSSSIVHFSNSIADLEYIGLLQASKKADFINKIVWL